MKIPKNDYFTDQDQEDYDIMVEYYENYYEDNQSDEAFNLIDNLSVEINLNLQVLTWFINLFHLIFLTRKQLRSNAIFIFMIAICISDLINLALCNYDFDLQYTDSSVPRKIVPDTVTYYCMKDKWMPIYIEGQIRSTVFEVTKRLSVWFAIVMSFIRTISVIFPMSNRVQTVSSPKWTLLIILGITVVWLIEHTWHMPWFYRYFWLPDIMPKFCPWQPKTETQVHVLVFPETLTNWLIENFDIVETILKFLPAILYPILTVFLLCQLSAYKRKRQKSVASEKSDNTNLLVLVMTITFMLSEGNSGFHGLIEHYRVNWMRWTRGTNWTLYISLITLQFPTLRTVNVLSHVIICLIMSQAYRDAIKSLFCCFKREKNKFSAATVVRKSTSVSKTSSLATIA
ncbi:Protein CBG18607 [Caenorhabditis briggsae]|uniref:Protein CBG18607 n=2 Tax=Caenorhabditis briggsae TaxID=6238 RepID=A8XTP8_CAEBR|nr:Protein CBG18607 [Caenorhabditis briggsae]CAP36024.1 Protein CBG18607 [Caenorhabditis briggsae]